MFVEARHLLIAYAAANALLYSSLLPLWEGFDEPFHFGYVQQLANGWGFPDLRTARLSKEVAQSIVLAPASNLVQRNLPQVTSYADFFSWPAQRRAEVRQELHEIPPRLSSEPSSLLNYEAQQAPLAYVLLALPERGLAGLSITTRVLALRILVGLAGALLLLLGAQDLFSQLGLAKAYREAALFCLLSCQMVWATLAHVANDWLAVPLSVWLLTTLIRYWRHPSIGAAGVTSGILSAGLLAKAYFIAFVPLVLAICAARRRWREFIIAAGIVVAVAGPWYGYNLIRFGAITGTQEARAGVGLGAAVQAAPAMHWPALVYSGFHQALWTGNNTFLSFSAKTLDFLIVFWMAALVGWLVTRHKQAEWITVFFCASFAAALAYVSAIEFVYTNGAANGPAPWYSQVLMAPMLGLAGAGLQRRIRPGRILAIFLTIIFGYVLMATYLVKLIPLYGGYQARTSFRAVVHLYLENWRMLASNLGDVSLAPAGLLFGLTGVVVLLAILLQFVTIRALVREQAGS